MEQTGTVEYVSQKTEAASGKKLNSPLFSFKLNDEWFGCGFDDPRVAEGDTITFTFNSTQYGSEVVKNSIVKTAADTSPAAATKKVSSPDARQVSIVYQSSRKDAINAIDIAVSTGVLTLPKGKGYEVLFDLIDELTLDFARKAIQPDLSENVEVDVEVVDE